MQPSTFLPSDSAPHFLQPCRKSNFTGFWKIFVSAWICFVLLHFLGEIINLDAAMLRARNRTILRVLASWLFHFSLNIKLFHFLIVKYLDWDCRKSRLSIIHGIHVWREWLRRIWLQIVLSWQHVYCVVNPNCLKWVGETVSNPLASSRIHAELAFIGKKPPDCQRDGLRSFQLFKYLKLNILVCTPSTEKCFQGWHKHPFNRKANINWSFTSDFRIPIFLQST